jgi:hypothetical protein
MFTENGKSYSPFPAQIHYVPKAKWREKKIVLVQTMDLRTDVPSSQHNGISGETSASQLLSMSGSRAFSSLLLPAPCAVMHLLFSRRAE